MKVEYSKRATAAPIAARSGMRSRRRVEKKIRETIAHLTDHPEAYAPVVERPGMRVVPLSAIRTRSFIECE
jgi:hypothetical protein